MLIGHSSPAAGKSRAQQPTGGDPADRRHEDGAVQGQAGADDDEDECRQSRR